MREWVTRHYDRLITTCIIAALYGGMLYDSKFPTAGLVVAGLAGISAMAFHFLVR